MTQTALTDSGDALWATAHGATACFTGRAGGVSAAPYDSFNLGPWTDDDAEAVVANHRRVEEWASEDRPRRLVIGQQIHETNVAVHLDGFDEPRLEGVDAHVTDRPDLAIGVLTADCVPVLLLAPWGVAAAHAGWRGLAGGVVASALSELAEVPGAPDGDDLSAVVAVVGPCAGPCCYEVGEEVHAAFEGWPQGRAEGRTIDLPTLAKAALEHAGVGEVVLADRCTICDPRYFSHRASGGTTGRQAGVVWRS
ncbi:MAG: polyphenol oxidase family protein [Solirubrobacteraceae bacterium]|nr:polyphenol oxidase family protein [Patulibacter sp.]